MTLQVFGEGVLVGGFGEDNIDDQVVLAVGDVVDEASHLSVRGREQQVTTRVGDHLVRLKGGRAKLLWPVQAGDGDGEADLHNGVAMDPVGGILGLFRKVEVQTKPCRERDVQDVGVRARILVDGVVVVLQGEDDGTVGAGGLDDVAAPDEDLRTLQCGSVEDHVRSVRAPDVVARLVVSTTDHDVVFAKMNTERKRSGERGILSSDVELAEGRGPRCVVVTGIIGISYLASRHDAEGDY